MSLAPTEIRRYLLGTATEDERTAIEQAYFGDTAAFEMVEAEEEALIERYLDGHLAPDELAPFERHYLASPLRRQRVEQTRHLLAAAARRDAYGQPQPRPQPGVRRRAVLAALAAAALVIVATRVWTPPPAAPPSTTDAGENAATATSPASTATAPVSPVIVVLSPMTVRSGQEVPTLSMPPGIPSVILRLEGEARTARPGGALQAVLRTVDGVERWQGPARPSSDDEPGVVAEVEVPASLLTPDDYLLDLIEQVSGRQTPVASYFLRLRG